MGIVNFIMGDPVLRRVVLALALIGAAIAAYLGIKRKGALQERRQQDERARKQAAQRRRAKARIERRNDTVSDDTILDELLEEWSSGHR